MKICPIALAVGCAKCPAFKICPAKGVLGGYVAAGPADVSAPPRSKSSRKGRKRS